MLYEQKINRSVRGLCSNVLYPLVWIPGLNFVTGVLATNKMSVVTRFFTTKAPL